MNATRTMKMRSAMMRMNSRLVTNALCGIALAASLSGCLPTIDATRKEDSAITLSEFSGVTMVTNINGPLKIEWTASTAPVKGYNIYYQSAMGDFVLIGHVDATQTSFIHGSSGSASTSFIGKIHTYRVRAVDLKGIEDANTASRSALSYSGILSAQVISKTSVKVLLPAVSGSFDEVRIYAKSAYLGDNAVQVATATSEQSEVTVSNLKSGVSYILWAQAYSEYLDKEDGNTVTTTAQTLSHTADGYQGVFHVQAYGPAPNAPSFQPKTEIVIISWVNFSNGGNGTKYRLVRVPKDGFLYTNPKSALGTLDYCTKNSTAACIVSDCAAKSHETDMMVLGPTCIDTEVEPAPAVYDYAVVMVRGTGADEYAEEIELGNQDLYRIRVQIPPKNMALVHRDAVNFEMCQLLRSPTIPQEHQKCPFNGYGTVPLNSGPGQPPLGLTADHYDFGYNLFVDRWELGCDYDVMVTSGTLGATEAGVYADKVVAVPLNLRINAWPGMYGNSSCRLARNGRWYGAPGYHTSTTATYRNFEDIMNDPLVSKLYTNDPITRGGMKTFAAAFGLNQAWNACQTQEDPHYGKKRLPRMREFRAYAAFPWIPGEKMHNGSGLYSSSLDTNGISLRTSPQSAGYYNGSDISRRACMTWGSTVLSWGDVSVAPDATELLNDLTDRTSNRFYPAWVLAASNPPAPPVYGNGFIGSNITSGCLSRFGLQDVVGSQKEYVSDRIGECNPRPLNPIYNTPYNQCYTQGESKRCVGYTLDFAIESGFSTASCSLGGLTGVGQCPAYTSTTPAGWIKYCTGTGGGLDSGNVDLSPFALNPLLPPYSYRLTGTTRDYNNYKIGDNVFSNYFNPALGIPTYDNSIAYTYTTEIGAPSNFSKTFSATPGDQIPTTNLQSAIVAGLPPVRVLGTSEIIVLGNRGYDGYHQYNGTRSYVRRIALGGGVGSGANAGRWQTEIQYQPPEEVDVSFENWGARCVLPAE